MENKEVRLIDAPVGLLMYKKCMLMKTEYGSYYDGVFSPDCYIVESGEVFVGGTDNAEYRNNLIVTPIDPASLRPHGEWFECDYVEYDGHSECIHYPKAALGCTNCRNAYKITKMDKED